MNWTTGFLGGLLMIAPFALGFNNNTTALWVNLVAGFLIIMASLVEWLRENKEDWEYWANGVIGVATILAPFIFNFTSNNGAMWSSIVLGALVSLTSVAKLIADEPKHVPFIHQ